MKWLIQESGPKSPCWNMEADKQALENIGEEPILRFYDWSAPSVTYGYFVDPWEFFDRQGVEKNGLLLARRPTGGGIIFHENDLSFSLTVPATHPFYSLNSLHSYQKINGLILKAIQESISCDLLLPNPSQAAPRGGFCMAKPTKYDLLVADKKIGGAAQRKTKKGLLHQVSLCLKLPEPAWLKEVLNDGDVISDAIHQASVGIGVEYKERIKRQIINELK